MPGVARVVVVTRAGDAFEAVPSMADPRVAAVVNPNPTRGMFSSIQAGLAAAGGDVVLVLPADMPFVATETVTAVIARAAATGSVVVPVHQTRRGRRSPSRDRCATRFWRLADDDAQGRARRMRAVDGPARRA